MDTLADAPTASDTLVAVTDGFYGNDLPAAVRAGQAVLDAIDPASRHSGQQALRARTLLWLVRCARRADVLDTALSQACAGIEAARAAGDCVLECLLRAQSVHVLASLGQNEAALGEGYKVLRRAADSGSTLAEAACWLALGHVHWAMLQWRDAEQAYTQASTLARLCGDREIGGLASNGIAAVADHDATAARAAGRADEAQAHARRSLALLVAFTRSSVEIGDTYNAWIGRHNQACCLFGMGEHGAARALLNKQLALLAGDRGTRRQLILQVLGDIHLADGQHALAIACQTEALQIAEELRLPLLALDASRSLADALERSGDHRAALAQHRRFHAFYVQLASNKAQAQARALAVIYGTERTLTLAEAQRQRADALASANSSLVQEKADLQRSALEDGLTGLANRRRFDQALAQLAQQVGNQMADQLAGRGHAAPDAALAMIDVDLFKRINDRFSHAVGDEVLRRLGGLLQRCCRSQDLAARYGGEEFALILTAVDQPTARAACERVRAAVQAEPWQAVHPDLRVTVSIGLVHTVEADAASVPHSLLAMADARLYAAKRGGRNRVVGSLG